MHAGQLERAESLAAKIRPLLSLQQHRVEARCCSSRFMYNVGQLTGKSKSSTDRRGCQDINAEVLNSHYTAISSDSTYHLPDLKQTASYHKNLGFQMFNFLGSLRPTATGLDNLPACFLQAFFRSSSRRSEELVIRHVGGAYAMKKCFNQADT